MSLINTIDLRANLELNHDQLALNTSLAHGRERNSRL